MKKTYNIILFCIHGILILCILAALFLTYSFREDLSIMDTIRTLDRMTASVNGAPEEIVTLPHTFEKLPPRTPVTLTATFIPTKRDALYIKSVYSPAKIYFNKRLAYEFGAQRLYPSFMIDPATEVHVIEVNAPGEPVVLRMEFLSPISRNELVVHPPMIAEPKVLIYSLFHQLGLPVIFSIAQMLLGISMIFISLCIMCIDRKKTLFLWLGLFSLTTGFWVFGENNFACLAVKNPVFMYLLSFTGLFIFIIPLLHFSQKLISFRNPRLIWGMEIFFLCGAVTALLLQLFGIVSCSKSMYVFHILLPLALVILTVLTVLEYWRYKNRNAGRFMLPIGALSITSLLELMNYQFVFTYLFSSLFQLGILIFLLIIGVLSGIDLKDSIELRAKQKDLEFRKNLLDIQTEEQKKSSLMLAENEQRLSLQRHDLRHHIALLQELAGDNEKMQAYLETLMEKIPKARERFCENRVVNAIVSHYYSICEKENIALTVRLVVPSTENQEINSDLCTIFANLLENAAEACGRTQGQKKFIRLNSTVQYGTLVITMDNSFNGEFQKEGDRFRSSKRNAPGIGLESVRSIAQKAHGEASFQTEGNVFLSSVYLQIPKE